jgi:hypothetical protein
VENIVERGWRSGYTDGGIEYERGRELSMDEVIDSMTATYLFGAIDQTRKDINARVDLIQRLLEQETG